MKNTISKVRVFRTAGRICLIRHKNDGSNSKDPADIFTSDRTVVDNVATTFSKTTEDMNDGNSVWPAATYQTGIGSTAAPTFNTVDMDLWAFVTGATKIVERNSSVPKISISRSVEAIADGGRVLLDSKISKTGIFVVRNQWDGSDYIVSSASGAPSTSGTVSVNYETGEIKFHTDDVGKVVYISCEFIVPEQVSYQMPSVPRHDTFTLILSGESYDKDGSDELWDSYVVDSCSVTGDISVPPRQKMPGGWTLTFSISKPRGEGNAIKWSVCSPASGVLKELTVISVSGTNAGETDIDVTPQKDAANSYVYQTGTALELPSYGAILESGWTAWDGTGAIVATTGHAIIVAEINSNKECVGAGKATVESKA